MNPGNSETNHEPVLNVNDSSEQTPNKADDGRKYRKLAIVAGCVMAVGCLIIGGRVFANRWINVYAETSAKANLITGFKNMAKRKPTVITGNMKLDYKDSFITTTADLSFKNSFDSTTGNPSGSGQLLINGAPFAYNYINIHKDTYFKLDNLNNLKKVVKQSNPLYGYYNSKSKVLNKYSNKWLVASSSSNQTNSNQTGGKYSCVLSTYPYFDSSNAQQLQRLVSTDFPFKILKSSSTVINKEKLTKIDLVANSPSAVNSFSDKLNNLSTVQKLNSCSQSIANTSLLQKTTDAFNNNSVKASVYITKDKEIRRIDITTAGNKTTTSISTTFDYTKQSKQVAPKGAMSADVFIEEMTQ